MTFGRIQATKDLVILSKKESDKTDRQEEYHRAPSTFVGGDLISKAISYLLVSEMNALLEKTKGNIKKKQGPNDPPTHPPPPTHTHTHGSDSEQ